MDELTIGDKTYISSKKAAQITGYAKDYVGQLCRGGYVDARMVGRNWYVLESSIRAHRFGNETKKDQPIAEEGKVAGANPPHQGWEAPAYVPERPVGIPVIESRAAVLEKPVITESSKDDETATDMQSAWKEWFAKKQDALESPQVIEAREAIEEAPFETEIEPEHVEESVPVYIHPMEAEALQEAYTASRASRHEEDAPQPVTIRRTEEPVYRSAYSSNPSFKMEISAEPRASFAQEVEEEQEEREKSLAAPRKARSSLITKTLLVGIMLISVTVGVLGSGFGDRYNYSEGTKYITLHFLNGSILYKAHK